MATGNETLLQGRILESNRRGNWPDCNQNTRYEMTKYETFFAFAYPLGVLESGYVVLANDDRPRLGRCELVVRRCSGF